MDVTAFPTLSGHTPLTDAGVAVGTVAYMSPGTTARQGAVEAHWTPDGRGIAYIDPRTQSDLWVRPLDGGASRQLTHFPADGHRIWDFAWSADGKRLAVARARISSDIVLFRGLGGTRK